MPLLVEIEQHAGALGPHLRQRAAQLRAAVAFERAQQIAGETGRMEPRQHRAGAVGLADLDGIMFLAAVLGANDVQPPGLGYRQRQARADHRVERADGLGQRRGGGGIDKGQRPGGGKARRVIERQHQRRRQEPRRLGQPQRQPVQPGVALAV